MLAFERSPWLGQLATTSAVDIVPEARGRGLCLQDLVPVESLEE